MPTVDGHFALHHAALEAVCEQIRNAGFSRKDSQQIFGATDVTFPVLGASGQAIAAFTCPFLKRIDEYVTPSLEEATQMLGATVRTLSMFWDGDGS